MLLKLSKYLHGYVKISVTGYSPERFLNLCNVKNILLWDVETHDFSYEMYLSVKNYKKLRPLVQKTRTKVKLLEKHGFPFFLYRFRKRNMFFFGIIFSAILIYLFSLFIWNIHIEGNVTQSTEEILNYLETLQVKHGVQKNSILCEMIETKLRSQYPNILWVSAEMRGTRILIQIKENTDSDIISKIEKKQTCALSLIADADGTVASMIVRQGTPLVSEGNEVTKGQVLVAGYYEIKNDDNEILRYEEVNADADIFLLTENEYMDSFLTEYDSKIYTKKKRLGIIVSLFEKKWEFNPKIPFQKFDLWKKKLEIHVTENFYLPFSVEFQWFREYETISSEYSEDELKSIADKRLQRKYENNLQKGVQIIEKDVRIVINGKLCRVSGTITLKSPVTTKIPAEIPEINDNISEEGENSI